MRLSTLKFSGSLLVLAATVCGWRAMVHRRIGPAEKEARALVSYCRDTLIGFQAYEAGDPKIAERLQSDDLRQSVVDTLKRHGATPMVVREPLEQAARDLSTSERAYESMRDSRQRIAGWLLFAATGFIAVAVVLFSVSARATKNG